ncbi:hypothetical protein MMC16_003157 [Acarospora aff. strigata]|nr:hypothetical protein [Acarospora aff. strigata]
MSKRRKLAVLSIFILAGLDILASIIRNYMMVNVTFNIQDITWIDADSLMLAFVEPCVGIVCACLPALRPLFRNMPTLRSFTRSKRFKGGHHTDTPSSLRENVRCYLSKRSLTLPKYRHEEFSFEQKSQTTWLSLKALGDWSVTSETHCGRHQREQAVVGQDGLPLPGIEVKSDLK